MVGQWLRVPLAHQVADPFRVDGLVGVEGGTGAAAERAQYLAELVANDLLAHQLVGEVVVDEEVVVEEMTEGAVADVVQKPGHPEQLLQQRRRGSIAAEDRAERRVELLGEPPGKMHRPEGVLEAAVLGGGKHPARRLQLRDPPEPLHPGRVDDVLLGHAVLGALCLLLVVAADQLLRVDAGQARQLTLLQAEHVRLHRDELRSGARADRIVRALR